MPSKSRSPLRRLLLVCMALILLLTACGSGSDAAPTVSLEGIATSAYMTFSAEMATKDALASPTATASPSPSPAATLPPPLPLATFAFASSTPLVTGNSDCDDAQWVADVTVPDGSIFKPGEKFTKTWRMLNSGTCAWTTGYKLVFESGRPMGGTSTFIPLAVPVGSQADVSVELTAPSDSGLLKGNWRLQNEKNQPFGSQIYVLIQVGAGDSITPGATSATGNVTISGKTDKPQVTITWTGATGKDPSGSTLSADNGDYSFTVPSGWYGQVVPSKGGYKFDPPSRNYPHVTSDQSGQDYDSY